MTFQEANSKSANNTARMRRLVRLWDLSVDGVVGAWCFGHCRPAGFLPVGLFLLRLSVLCAVRPLSLLCLLLHLDLCVLADGTWVGWGLSRRAGHLCLGQHLGWGWGLHPGAG